MSERQRFEAACAEKAKFFYLGQGRGMCVVLGAHKMFVPTNDCSLVPHLISLGFWESWISCAMFRAIRTGDICIDVGANLGYYSLLMAMKSRTGQVVAIEANPDLFDHYLKKTFKVNGMGVRVVSSAAWDKDGELLNLTIPYDELGGAHVLGVNSEFVDGVSVKVETTKIDSLVDRLELKKVDFVKIDAEGSEPRILEGMTKTIEDNPKLQIFMEYSPESDGIGPELYDRVRELGFTVAVINGQSESKRIGRDQLSEKGIDMWHLRREK